MRRFYWWPNRRVTYRIVKVRHWIDDYKLQQRYRWLWFEWWRNVDGGDLDDMKERKHHFESIDSSTEAERVVDVTR